MFCTQLSKVYIRNFVLTRIYRVAKKLKSLGKINIANIKTKLLQLTIMFGYNNFIYKINS